MEHHSILFTLWTVPIDIQHFLFFLFGFRFPSLAMGVCNSRVIVLPLTNYESPPLRRIVIGRQSYVLSGNIHKLFCFRKREYDLRLPSTTTIPIRRRIIAPPRNTQYLCVQPKEPLCPFQRCLPSHHHLRATSRGDVSALSTKRIVSQKKAWS